MAFNTDFSLIYDDKSYMCSEIAPQNSQTHKARNIINNVMILPEISLFKQSEDRVCYEKSEITVEKFAV